jgi:hypothetical protein
MSRAGSVLWVLLLIVATPAQEPPSVPPQQPFVIRDTNYVTNVVVSVTTTINEIQGVRVDGRFIPLRTNLMFKTTTNLWTMP